MSSTVRLTRSDSMWIHCHGKELAGIPAPSETWQWSEVDVGHDLLCALRNRDLIVQADDGWKTDERLEELGYLDVLEASSESGDRQLRFSQRLLAR